MSTHTNILYLCVISANGYDVRNIANGGDAGIKVIALYMPVHVQMYCQYKRLPLDDFLFWHVSAKESL